MTTLIAQVCDIFPQDEVEKLESDTTTRHAAEVAAFQAVAVPVQLTEVSSLISACNGTGRGTSPTKAEVVPKVPHPEFLTLRHL
jgi:hypothetical protein